MLAETDVSHVYLGFWSAFVLGYGFALGGFFAHLSLAMVAGALLLVAFALTH